MAEKHTSVTEARRQLEEVHAKLAAQTENPDYLEFMRDVVDSITDEDIQQELDKAKEQDGDTNNDTTS